VSEAIAEVGRYTKEKITVDDPRIAELRVSGTFRTGEVEAFIDALSKLHPLAVERADSHQIRLVWRE
jgi:transmembrane sensor